MRARSIPRLPVVGSRFEAKILRRKKYVYLSVRRLKDPWRNPKNTYLENQVVQGEVVGIRRFGAFIQLEPGIDAIVRLTGLPLLRDQLPRDVLSIGDYVQGVITGLDWEKHKIEPQSY